MKVGELGTYRRRKWLRVVWVAGSWPTGRLGPGFGSLVLGIINIVEPLSESPLRGIFR